MLNYLIFIANKIITIMLFSLVLHRVVSAIASNCPELLFHMWYLDDGAKAGPKLAVLRALSIVQDLGLLMVFLLTHLNVIYTVQAI